MRIRLSRDSVAAGDDVVSHDNVIDVEEHTPLSRLIADIISSRYLPSIYGGEATWLIRTGRHGRFLGVVAQQWPAPKLLHSEAPDIAGLGNELHFEYLTQHDPAAVFDELARQAEDNSSDTT